MGKKHETHVPADLTAQLKPLVDDDKFLTELSRGNAPEGDPLAALFLELREDVEAAMPPAPLIEGAELEPEVISLADVKRRRRVNPWVSGLVGAAAATMVLAGSGAVIHAATPGSPLYGARGAIFGTSDAAVVELASTLEEIQSRADQGDIDGTRELLEQAQKQLTEAQAKARENQRETAEPRGAEASVETHTVTETATTTVSEPAPTSQPKEGGAAQGGEPAVTTVYQQTPPTTEYVVSTVVVTEYAVAPNPLPAPSGAAPTGEPTERGTGTADAPVGGVAVPQVER